MTDSPLLQIARSVVEEGGRALGLDDLAIREFLEPEVVTQVELSVDGMDRPMVGWRVRHSTVRGPAKGGVRFTPSVTCDDVVGLATLMTLKTAVTGLPFGGGKGGVAIAPGLTDGQRMELARQYGAELSDVIGPDVDVPAPDIGTGGQTVVAMAGGWADALGVSPDSAAARSVTTGKPDAAGGIELRTGSTARGLHIAIDHLARHHDLAETPRVAIQGFGAVGGALAAILHDQGWSVVAVADSSGTISDPTGLDITEVRRAKKAEGSVTAAEGETGVAGDVLRTETDLLVVAATEAAITEAVAHDVRASAVVEGSNAPCTPAGDRVLADRGITVVPDIVANAGGVTGSWLEWEHSRGNPIAEPGQRFHAVLHDTNERLWRYTAECDVRLREAATALALAAVRARA